MRGWLARSVACTWVLAGGCPGTDDTLPPSDTSATDTGASTDQCPLPVGSIDHTATITADESWDPSTIHRIPYGLRVDPGATLTLPPCTVVEIAAEATLEIDGRLDAVGAAGERITIRRADADAWGELLVAEGGYADLAFVTLTGGGGQYFHRGATITLWGGSGYEPVVAGKIQSVRIEDSVGVGLALDRMAVLEEGSTDLVVTGCGTWPAQIHGAAGTTFPDGTYTGNGLDRILIDSLSSGDVTVDSTLHDRGVPYQVGPGGYTEHLVVDGYRVGGTPVLTIEPGVELQFADDGGLYVGFDPTVGPTGALRAVGTAAQPVRFTSGAAAAAAGDWMGLYFEGDGLTPLDPRNEIAFATIEYAGGWSATSGFSCDTGEPFLGASDAAVIFLGEASASTLHDATIDASAAHGVTRGWRGGPIDLLASNTFTNVAGCKQTYPIPEAESCPVPPPCP